MLGLSPTLSLVAILLELIRNTFGGGGDRGVVSPSKIPLNWDDIQYSGVNATSSCSCLVVIGECVVQRHNTVQSSSQVLWEENALKILFVKAFLKNRDKQRYKDRPRDCPGYSIRNSGQIR